jgi:Cof subfamily protein (haloacid dehalogenase superfamily)
MTRKVVFLDIDGTLLNETGLVPATARTAVQQARANGHLMFLCTGRSLSEIWPEIMDIGFDGVIAAAGGYVECDGQVLTHQNVPVDQVRRVVAFFDARGINYFLEANSGLYGSAGIKSQLRQMLYGGVTDENVLAELERGFGPFIDHVVVGEDPARDDINKISFLGSDTPYETIRVEFSDVFDVIPATVPQFEPNSGELSIAGIHKAGAIETLLEHLGIPVEDTMAYGDGHNDLEMLQYVNVGVAMGNAHQKVKDIADDITGSPDEDGLMASFRKYGLIQDR